MSAGRPPDGLRHVDRLPGPDADKWRLRLVLETLTGELSVAEASAELKMTEARFHQLRRQVLQGALESVHAGPAGRPSDRMEKTPREMMLERQVKELQFYLRLAETKEELAVIIPEAVQRASKKNAGREKKRTKSAGEKPGKGPKG